MATTATMSKRSLWGGGAEPFKASYGKLMMWFFLLSDAFTFSGLLITYAFLRWSAPQYKGDPSTFTFSTEYWPIPEKVYNAFPGGLHGDNWALVFVGLMTFILILSSVTMVLAVEAGQRMDKKAVVKWMLWTIIGGIAFLGCQAWEWSHFISGTDTATISDVVVNGIWKENYEIFGANLTFNQYGPPAFAALFFFITGFHGFHVFSGVVLNVIIFFNAANGLYEKRGHYEMVEKVGLYWHFVDLVWVFVFTFFYLI
ncbi:cytochrome c oxidase subunit 3 [Roseivirga pacifica]|uniref:cytochrome c oxidase subunit 3 n=1 Tax=Roseivirga pacifica TaxID=1267423 RepID=UPI0020965679|nr:cytochrome c oxidase subunit 3 [Roseivirga pacifica]MCO6357599.1 cytochrome oxidase subunit III [Roseivirga pacifica]MCO6365852.1 cytochrome oxidase subunit III [Roseivirga pacifica]MCO6371180.1 cytochrome oxidase subunit III [Roseivirga pacifica]MCO6375649.1 cytochrome oxidase subunit III [Roseivirga pacifica]MCO6378558.1 cytochrome oxidase subunit III [Roseivirga pacifica]